MQTTAHPIQNLRLLGPEWLACPDMVKSITSQRVPLQHVTCRSLQLMQANRGNHGEQVNQCCPGDLSHWYSRLDDISQPLI
jgi:hypothetical protein